MNIWKIKTKEIVGISLIVLVITIIVVIILAAAVILAMTNNNPIKQANEAVFKSDMKSYVESASLNMLGELETNPGIVNELIIGEENVKKYIPVIDYLKYPVYIEKARLTINKSNYSDEEVRWAKEVGILVGNPISNLATTVTQTTINVSIDTTSAGITNYMFRLYIGDTAQGEWVDKGTVNSHQFIGLNPNTEYRVVSKVIENNVESEPMEKTVKTKEISGEVEVIGIPADWTNVDLVLTLKYDNIPSGYKIQYKLGTGEFIDYTTAIQVSSNQVITTRLYNQAEDKEAIISSSDITKIDKDVPNVASISMPGTSASKSFSATVTQSDSLSGMNVSQSKYKLSTIATPFGITSTEWNSGASTFSSINQTLSLSANDGTYYLHVLTTDNAGNKRETVSSSIIVSIKVIPSGGSIYTDSEGNKAPIPNGFVVSAVAEENTVNGGLVIKQGNDGASTSSNEFVWVPVPDITEMYDEATKRGKLYDFAANRVSTLRSDCLTTTSGNREPDVVSGDGGSSDTVGITKTMLQNEFNAMVDSVKKYKGFYIGRYETGDLSKSTVVVKKGNSDIHSQTWYTMYSKSKAMISNSYVQTGMIWGSQWDATLRYMNKYEDTGNYASNSTGKGNYNRGLILTGSNEAYKVKNIYDMAGNVYDWTMEANSSNRRVIRGGYYGGSGSDHPASYRNAYYPYYSSDYRGLRLALSLK